MIVYSHKSELDGKEVGENRLKVGEYYYMDKRKPHWVVNNSKNYEFHVIMDIECEEKHLDEEPPLISTHLWKNTGLW